MISLERLVYWSILIEALPGDKVVVTVDGINKEGLRRGFVVSDMKNDPAREILSFVAQVCITFFAIGICLETAIFLN
jgi:translation elongation factor EF-1alpha